MVNYLSSEKGYLSTYTSFSPRCIQVSFASHFSFQVPRQARLSTMTMPLLGIDPFIISYTIGISPSPISSPIRIEQTIIASTFQKFERLGPLIGSFGNATSACPFGTFIVDCLRLLYTVPSCCFFTESSLLSADDLLGYPSYSN